MSQKAEAKALRAPDAFQRAGGEVRDVLMARGPILATGLGVVLVLVMAFLLWDSFRLRGEEKATLELGRALRVVDRDEGATADPNSGLPGDPPPFADEKAKDQAIEESLNRFRTEKAGSAAATLAGLPLGQAELRLNKPDTALPLLSAFADQAKPEDPLRVLAFESEGYAHEAKGELDQALASYSRMTSDNKTELLAGMGQYHRARILLLQGKKQEAAAAFAEVATVAPTSAAARLAAERTAELAQQGIVAPSPIPSSAPTGGIPLQGMTLPVTPVPPPTAALDAGPLP